MTKGKFLFLFILIILIITGVILIKQGTLPYNIGIEYIRKSGKPICVCIKGPDKNKNAIITFNKQKEIERGKSTVDQREYYQGIKPLSIAPRINTEKNKYYYRVTAINNKLKTITFLKIAFLDKKGNILGEFDFKTKLTNGDFYSRDYDVPQNQFVEKYDNIKILEMKLESGEHFKYKIHKNK